MSSLLKLLFVFLAFIPLVHADEPATTQASEPVKLSFEEHFRRGTQSYQDKKFDEAIVDFEKALDLHPESAAVLTDLGLSYFQAKKKGLSVAMFRRALFLDPSHSVAGAGLTFVLSQLEVKEIPHQIETYERLRSTVLNTVSLNGFHVLSLLLLFSSGFIWLKFLGRRRKALEEEGALPNIPVIGILLSIGLVFSLVFTALKIYDINIPRATIVSDKVSAQTAPGEGQNSLFDLYEGFEVIIRNASNDWVQVSYPGGLTGWVKKDTLMSTSGKNAF